MEKVIFMCFIFSIAPIFSHAAVTINEVAWMGNAVSANDEWIELYNSGSQSVSVEGWVLGDGMNLEIVLTGAVGAGQYAVLERTDDSSAPGTAFLVYTGGLVNGGAALSLYRADGSLEDKVVGGENWQNIGGDNITKETAQYTTAGWITAAPTPGAKNATTDTSTPDTSENTPTEEEGTDTAESTQGAGASNSTTLYATPRDLTLTLNMPKRVYVNQSVPMEIVPSGLAKGILQSVQYDWNLGDLSLKKGKNITARYAYPGEYVVTVNGSYKDYQSSIRQTITILPVAFSMTVSPQGEVQVHNDARYEVDISQYRLVSNNVLIFPKGTILLPNATITIPKDRLQFVKRVVLLDEVGVEVARVSEKTAVQKVGLREAPSAPAAVPASYTPLVEVPAVTNATFNFAEESKNKTPAPIQGTSSEINTPTQALSPIEPTRSTSGGKLPYFALLAVIGLGVTTVFVSRIKK